MASKQRQRKAGIWCVATAITLPIATYGAAHVWLANVSVGSPVPDQGAMLMAFFGVGGSLVIAMVVLGAGVALLVRSRTPRSH